MPIDRDRIRAVVFDYGNTLVEYTQTQIAFCDGALGEVLSQRFGHFDSAVYEKGRYEQRQSVYSNGYLENTPRDLAVQLFRQLYERDATDDELEVILKVRYESFVASIQAGAYVHDLLSKLRGRYKLGLLSNYPCGESIRASMARAGLDPHFDAVVVSGDVGRVKPHRLPFDTVIQQLGVSAEQTVHVGDNWLADIQGAKQAGLMAVHTVQWDTPEKFDPKPGDHEPDLTIRHLTELEAVLLDGRD